MVQHIKMLVTKSEYLKTLDEKTELTPTNYPVIFTYLYKHIPKRTIADREVEKERYRYR